MDSWFVNDCRNNDNIKHIHWILGFIIGFIELITLFVIAFIMISLCLIPIDMIYKVTFGFCFGMLVTFIIKHVQDCFKLINEYKKWLKK